MKVKDYFLSQEEFEIKETDLKGVYRTFPIPSNLNKYYESHNYISHHQDNGGVKEKIYKLLQKINFGYKKRIIKKIIAKNSKVLDYGCGAGEYLKNIENSFETFGYEPNYLAREAARKKTHSTKLINEINEIENDSLDAITLWHVFEHVENQSEILNIFENKLKSKGYLIIAVPNCSSHDANHYKKYWAAYDVPRHIYHFTKNGMINYIYQNPKFKIKKIKPLLLDSYYISMLSEKYKKSKLIWLKAIISGTISNVKAIFSSEFSSLIYIIQKK